MPLKVLFLSIEYPPETPDGIGSYVFETGRALTRRGHEVHVLSCLPGQASRDYRDGEIWVHRRDEGEPRGVRRLGRGERTAARLLHALACWREARALGVDFDVIETPDWMAEGLFFALARKPLLAQLHTPLAITSMYGVRRRNRDARVASFLERKTVEGARLVVSPSRLVADELSRQGWLKGKDVRIVRFSIDLERWGSGTPVGSTEPVVLYAARLEPLKAPEVLVEASALLAPELDGIRVLIAGRSASSRDGAPYGEWLANRIDELRAPCELLGQVPRAEVERLSSSARVFVLPSRYENLPFAGLEAMAAGRPVICTSNTGLAEILDGTGAGAVVPPGDAEALAAALRPYLADAKVAAAAGALARDLARSHCSPDVIAEERERCYLTVAGGEA